MYKVYSYSHNDINDITILIKTIPGKNITFIECTYTENGQTDDILKHTAAGTNVKQIIVNLLDGIDEYFDNGIDTVNYEQLCIPAQDGIYNALYKISEEY